MNSGAGMSELTTIVKKLQKEYSAIEACALISKGGLTIVNLLPPDMEGKRVAEVAVTLQNMVDRVAIALSLGEPSEFIVRGDSGYLILIKADHGALLLVLADKNSQLDLLILELRKALVELEKTLANASNLESMKLAL
jgi:predicted regulator of Ras-like GTPase activity (Roadblock/LC7/MglB family)